MKDDGKTMTKFSSLSFSGKQKQQDQGSHRHRRRERERQPMSSSWRLVNQLLFLINLGFWLPFWSSSSFLFRLSNSDDESLFYPHRDNQDANHPNEMQRKLRFRAPPPETNVDDSVTVNVNVNPQRIFPSFAPSSSDNNNHGGLILFFHVAKNGGTTIREYFKSHDHVVLVWKANFFRYLNIMRQIVEGGGGDNPHHLPDFLFYNNSNAATTTTTKTASNKQKRIRKTLVMEIHHVPPQLTLPELQVFIQKLRHRAQVNHVPFFVFTTLREPLSYALSFYNFQNLVPALPPPNNSRSSLPQDRRLFRRNATQFTRGKRYEAGGLNELDFVEVSLPNPQCLFFARGELATTVEFDLYGRDFTSMECHSLYYNVMRNTMDWIGTVENLENETLPLLAAMLSGAKNTNNDDDDVDDDNDDDDDNNVDDDDGDSDDDDNKDDDNYDDDGRNGGRISSSPLKATRSRRLSSLPIATAVVTRDWFQANAAGGGGDNDTGKNAATSTVQQTVGNTTTTTITTYTAAMTNKNKQGIMPKRNVNLQRKKLLLKQLSPSAIAQIRQKTSADLEMYQQAQKDYIFQYVSIASNNQR